MLIDQWDISSLPGEARELLLGGDGVFREYADEEDRIVASRPKFGWMGMRPDNGALPAREELEAKLADLAAERLAINDAVKELSGKLALERERASRLIVAQFEAQRRTMASEFFKHIAAAATVHSEFGAMVLAFHRQGVSPSGLHDFGQEILGEPGHRNGDVGIAMRAAVKAGYLPASMLPEDFR